MKNPKHMPPGIGKSKSSSKPEDGSPTKKEKDKTKFKVTFIDKVEKDQSLT